MPAYTLGEIMSQATARIGRRADIPESVCSFWANAAYLEVASAVPHAMQERIAVSSLTSGYATVSLPSDYGEPISFQVASTETASGTTRYSYTTLAQASPAERDAFTYASGRPTHATFFNTYVELWPTPDSALSLQLRYRSMATDLISASDVPSISTLWRHAILLRTEAHLQRYVGNAEGASQSQAEYLGYVSQLDSDRARRQKVGSAGVRVVY